MAIGDTFISGDYLCTIWTESGVHIQANDKTKVSYATPPRRVTYGGRTYRTSPSGGFYGASELRLPGCFEGCENLKIGPDIPTDSDLIFDNLDEVFKGCTSLTSVGSLPTNLRYMNRTFTGCSSLVTAPVIPSNVAYLVDCFKGCTSLSGAVVINANELSRYDYMFRGTEKGIWLTGSSPQLRELAATANNGNVFVGEIPLSGSLTAERVGSDGGTTPEAEGNWLHVVLSISWSKFSANSLSSITLYDNSILNPITWYTDASKTSAVTLPGWRPAATAEAHAWVRIDGDTHTIQVSVADAYHTGEPVVITVPQVFRTIDFLAGGNGIAFGKIADQEGFDCAMDVLFEGSTELAVDTDATSGIDKEIYDGLSNLHWTSVIIQKVLNIKTLISRILQNLHSPIIVQTTTLPSTQYPANNATWVYSKDWHPTAIPGYTPIGVLQPTPSNQSSLIAQVTLVKETYGDRFIGVVRNIASSALTDTIALPILYIRDDLL